MAAHSDQDAIWLSIYNGARRILSPLGREDGCGDGDFWVLDDNWGNREHLIYISNLSLIQPSVILALQALLKDAPGWSIYVRLYMAPKGHDWPPMGLTLMPDEIIDELKREYLPPEVRSLSYPGMRPWDAARDFDRDAPED
jgi:hypothetical protein